MVDEETKKKLCWNMHEDLKNDNITSEAGNIPVPNSLAAPLIIEDDITLEEGCSIAVKDRVSSPRNFSGLTVLLHSICHLHSNHYKATDLFSILNTLITGCQYAEVGIFLLESGLGRPEFLSDGSGRIRKSNQLIQNLLELFYDFIIPDLQEDEKEESDTDLERQNIEELYDYVRCAHQNEAHSLKQDIQHPALIPVLRPYQCVAVNWMLKRENYKSSQTHDPCISCGKKLPHYVETLYYNPYTGCLIREFPMAGTEWPGGILADEMVLGKTVEVVALILINTRQGVGQHGRMLPEAAEMALKLSAINHCCVSGTPVQRGLEDLYGLVLFHGVDLYWVKHWWEQLLYHPYRRGNPHPLYSVIARLMWRSTKKDVLDQIQIPPQTEEVHWLHFSPVEGHLYHRQHKVCSQDALVKLRKISDWNLKLGSLDRRTVNSILYPLLRLRQACCHPQAVRGEFLPIQKRRNAEWSVRRHIACLYELSMAWLRSISSERLHATHNLMELLEAHRPGIPPTLRDDRLKVEAEQLRQHYMTKSNSEVAEAQQTLQPVLKNIKELKRKRLHATHNLMELLEAHRPGIPPTLRDDRLKVEAEQLRQHYMTKSNSEVAEAQQTLQPVLKNIKELKRKMHSGSPWWLEVIQRAIQCKIDEDLVLRIQNELTSNYKQQTSKLSMADKNSVPRTGWFDSSFQGQSEVGHPERGRGHNTRSHRLNEAHCCSQVSNKINHIGKNADHVENSRKKVYTEINETVICTKDLMEVDIPSAFFLNKVPPVYIWDLHLNDPECRGMETENSYVFAIKTNLSDCGTITVPAHLIMRLESCWATPTNDPYSDIQYTFIRDSCPEGTNEQTLAVLKNGESSEAMFRIQMFKFVGDSYKDVFLHCNVQICHNKVGVCQPFNQQKASKTYQYGDLLIMMPNCYVVNSVVSTVLQDRYQTKQRSMFTFVCGQLFRRDEFSSHFKNVHGDIHAGLNGWMEHRCPLAYYGCTYSQRRLCPSVQGSKIIHDRHLRSFGVQPSVPTHLSEPFFFNTCPIDSQCDHLSNLPFEILQHISGFLDGFSLCQLSKVSRLMRDICASLLQVRGMVILLWEKRQYPNGTFSWKIKDKVWKFSTAFGTVNVWKFANITSMADHLKKCKFNTVERREEAIPLPCMCVTRELTKEGRSLRSVLKPLL
ncbi:UNVERIFIED_CONTAM: hypothetical protein FKN15_007933 [Acipenser sinensis]